ncbi:MAG: type II secretion system F family protein [Actinomycetota bacterium]
MNPLTAGAVAVLLGGLCGGGLVSILAGLPRWRAASLTVRIAPYIRDVVPDALLPDGTLPSLGVLPLGGRGLWGRARVLFARLLGGTGVLQHRLGQAGSALAPSDFRGKQLAWTLAGFGAGALLVVVLALLGRASAPAITLPILGGASAAVTVEVVLTARARGRLARIADELPTMLEFLALCLSAGESLLDALRRVSLVGSGELTGELRRVILAVNTGSPLADALADLAARLQLPALSRAVDQVVAALERGAPLADVLHAQAGDAREDAKRVLLEQAGRKEILMLLPRNLS